MEEKNRIRGKKARTRGRQFELLVRKDLENKMWIVLRNSNNVIDGKFQLAKQKYNPITKRMLSFSGFPDFICFQNSVNEERKCIIGEFEKLEPLKPNSSIRLSGIIVVECKTNGYLDKIEKEKCKWLLENNIFSKILIAYLDYSEENISLPPEKRKKKIIKYKEFK